MMKRFMLAAALIVSAITGSQAAELAQMIPAPAQDQARAPQPGQETAVFAGGCFWGVQGVFQHVKGVTRAVSGYAGGAKETAQYRVVGSGTTGHAESVEITYDPSQITYGQLLQIFFSVAHDPTELNYQGPDHGTQYRSAIFPRSPEQKSVAAAYIAQLDKAKVFAHPIVTTLEDGRAFYAAEDYHQDYLTLNPFNPYIVYNDIPKVQALAKVFPALYRDRPVLVKS